MQTKEKRPPERVAADVIKAGGGRQLQKFGGGNLGSMMELLENGLLIKGRGNSVPNLVSGRTVLGIFDEEGLGALDQAARASFGETVVRDPFQAGITFVRISEPKRESVRESVYDPRDYGV